MNNSVKAQSSTEYLVILAIVIFIGMVIVFVYLSGREQLSLSEQQAESMKLSQADIGVVSAQVSQGSLLLEIANNRNQVINVTSVQVNGRQALVFGGSVISAQSSTEVWIYNVSFVGGQDTDVYLSFNYTELISGISYSEDLGNVSLDIRVGNLTDISTQEPLFEDLVVYLRFDDTTWEDVANEVVDSSPYGNDGRAKGGVNVTAGGRNKLAEFDGSDDYLTFANNEYFDMSDNNFTIALWFYLNENPSGSGKYLFNKWSTFYSLVIVANDNLRFKIYNGTVAQFARYTDYALRHVGEWKHITTSYNGTVSLYIDGVLVNSTTLGGNVAFNANVFEIGGYTYYADGHINASMDEFMIWERALSDDEVASVYERSKEFFQ